MESSAWLCTPTRLVCNELGMVLLLAMASLAENIRNIQHHLVAKDESFRPTPLMVTPNRVLKIFHTDSIRIHR